MEFYADMPAGKLINNQLQHILLISNLPILCRSINTVIEDNQSSGEVYCLWGLFKINREDLTEGVRFSFPECPNALAWSITLHQTTLTLHLTINKKYHDADFIDSINTFMADWVLGLRTLT